MRVAPPSPSNNWQQQTAPCAACNKPSVTGVPILRLSDTFESFSLKRNPGMQEALNRCKQVAAGEVWCAILAGQFGTGKTHLAIAALHSAGAGMFWKVPDMLDWIRGQAYDAGLGIVVALEGYRFGTSLLVLDDLGTEKRTEWVDEQVYRILDSRYELKLPTIITTNHDPGRIDGRIMSRFRQGLVVCKGKDVRA